MQLFLDMADTFSCKIEMGFICMNVLYLVWLPQMEHLFYRPCPEDSAENGR